MDGFMIVTADTCERCDAPAMASSDKGRLCGGHALVEAAREWNQGNWTWTARFDSELLAPPRPSLPQLIA